MKKLDMTIPKDVKDLAKEIAALGIKYDLRRLNVTISSNELWMGNSIISWEAGRHGDDAYRVHIRSEFHHWEEFKEPPTNKPKQK